MTVLRFLFRPYKTPRWNGDDPVNGGVAARGTYAGGRRPAGFLSVTWPSATGRRLAAIVPAG
jgi:hypothetical protein